MHVNDLYLATAAIAFFWCGSVTAISFLEAWLKFRAPGVTIQIGLGIGRLVFRALNRIEWGFAAACVACLLLAGAGRWTGQGWLLPAISMLAIETIWLLPALEKRAAALVEGRPPAPSSVHPVFIAAELIKLASLALAGIQIFKLL